MSFFDLPAELRCKIYRELLIDPRPIDCALHKTRGCRDLKRSKDDSDKRRHHEPHFTALLFVCREMYAEASEIFYRENTFDLKFSCGYITIMFKPIDDICVPNDLSPLKKMQRLQIVVKNSYTYEPILVRSSIEKVCRLLNEGNRLKHMEITLDTETRYWGWHNDKTRHEALEPLSMLRNELSVTFTNVPKVYARYLENCMTGSEPQEQLPNMYIDLQSYARPFGMVEDLMQKASEAKGNYDLGKFKEIRAQIIAKIKAHMDNKEQRLFDHDVEPMEKAADDDSDE